MLICHRTSGTLLAMIEKQPRAADSYRADEPWMLLHTTGRIDRFASMREARDEAIKTYGNPTFHRSN